MSDADQKALGRMESTLDHLGASLEEAKGMIRDSAASNGSLRVEVASGLARVEERQDHLESEVDFRFGVVDKRLDGTHAKLSGLQTQFAERVGDGPGTRSSNGRTAAVGAGGAVGGVGVWQFLERLWTHFMGGGSS